MTKIVVLGASGFVGQQVVTELEKRGGYEIIAADVNSCDFAEARFQHCDIMDPQSLEAVIDESIDYVYGLAGFASLDDAYHNPIAVSELNIMGNLNVLEACKKAKIKRYIYGSSAYAVSSSGDFYGLSKAYSEKLIELYHKRFDMNFTILRYGSIYGSGSSHNNYIYNLIRSALETGKISHDSDGEEIREYIHVDDVARLSVDVIEDEKFIDTHLILTGQERLKRRELFAMINEIVNNSLEVSFQEKPVEGRYHFTPYSYNPKQSLKMVANPFVDMGQGLQDCIKTVSLEIEAEKSGENDDSEK